MPRDSVNAGTLRPFGMLKAWACGALPRHPRTMLTYDASLAWAAIVLLAIGLVMVYSASIAMAEASAHAGFRSWYFLARHAMFIGVGVLAAFVAFQVPMKAWQQLAPWIFVSGVVLLALVFVPGIGKSVNGARRWLSLRSSTQPPNREARGRAVRASYARRVPACRAAVEADAGEGFPPPR
jgi:cell division protein FtsW